MTIESNKRFVPTSNLPIYFHFPRQDKNQFLSSFCLDKAYNKLSFVCVRQLYMYISKRKTLLER